MNLYFKTLAYNNAWANFRLLKVCKKLSAGEFAAPRVGFFPSLCKTLNHSYTVDLFYVDALHGGTLGYDAFVVDEPFLNAETLDQAQRISDLALIAFTSALTVEKLTATTEIHRGSTIQKERTDRLLLHLFQHQIHHRGQAHAMLSGTSIAPPPLDEFFSANDVDLRALDFQELGITEEQIWL